MNRRLIVWAFIIFLIGAVFTLYLDIRQNKKHTRVVDKEENQLFHISAWGASRGWR